MNIEQSSPPACAAHPILASLQTLSPSRRARFLDDLPSQPLLALPHLWQVWARPATQLPPPGDWSTWLVMGGRGSGKTRAGAEWVRAQVEGATPLARGRRQRLALLAETADQARDIMVLGESGILACTPRDRLPEFNLSRRTLTWPNGAQAQLFSAADPESLRGPQFDGAWSDELAKWKRAEPAWDMLQFGLRLGDDPRQIVTTTPRTNPTLIRIMEDPATVTTRSPTADNAANLAPGFLRHMQTRYAGRPLGRQELDGELLLETPGSLWTRAMLEAARITALPPLSRIVVAVDPPVTGRVTSDACGIIVAAQIADKPDEPPRAIVLADWSVQGRSPRAWATRAVAAYRDHRADRLVAEVNQGGDMVEQIIREVDPDISFRAVRATRGKALRAEPVAALYEQGRVLHLASAPSPISRGHRVSGGREGGLSTPLPAERALLPLPPPGGGREGGRETTRSLKILEDQMCAFAANAGGSTRFTGDTRSPDRVDALVWAITDLLLTKRPEPNLRIL